MTRTTPKSSDLTTIFVDESSQTAHRFLALGGLVLNNDVVDQLERRLAAARLPELPSGEMGWTKVSKSKMAAYKRFVDVFFDSGAITNPLEFHMLVIDTRKIKDRVFNKGSREVGFNKEVYQLCMKAARRLYPSRLFHVYLDERTTKSRTQDLRDILNLGLRTKGDARDWPFRRIHFRDSAGSKPVQLTDILLGAVMFKLNGHYDAGGASEAKKDLCDHILARAGIADPGRDTAIKGKFTIWHRQLK